MSQTKNKKRKSAEEHKVKLIYSDGTYIIRTFPSDKELAWFVMNEGDHCMKVEYIND